MSRVSRFSAWVGSLVTAILIGYIFAGCQGLIKNTGNTAKPDSPSSPTSTVAGYLTWKNDNARTGSQSKEKVLTPGSVNSAQFGLKFSLPVDGWVYAQPLYAAGLTIGGKPHNVVFVATEHDSVYAFDADKPGPPLWHQSFLAPGITPVQTGGNPLIPVQSEVGITSTPVIDLDKGTIYVLAQTVENGVFFNKLHALNISTGEDRTGSPAVVSAPGFDPQQEFVRSALLLANGNVYVAFASYGDILPYNGFLFAYDASTLSRVGVWSSTPAGGEGGIWMGAAGPAADQNGNIFVSTSNGDWDGVNNFGQSVVKLDSTLHLLDFFTPFDGPALSIGDHDLGSGGVLLVPDQGGAVPHLAVVCGKSEPIYVLNRDNLGKKNAADNSQIVQVVHNQLGTPNGPEPDDHCFTTAAFFQRNLYFIANNDVIKAFSLDPGTGKLSASPTSQGSFIFPFPGAQAVVSSNGQDNAIVWAVDFNFASPTSSLHAFDARDVSREIYRSPALGQASKFAVPTVVNGKVYVPAKNKIAVFGLN